jgi:hypothetical protein
LAEQNASVKFHISQKKTPTPISKAPQPPSLKASSSIAYKTDMYKGMEKFVVTRSSWDGEVCVLEKYGEGCGNEHRAWR